MLLRCIGDLNTSFFRGHLIPIYCSLLQVLILKLEQVLRTFSLIEQFWCSTYVSYYTLTNIFGKCINQTSY